MNQLVEKYLKHHLYFGTSSWKYAGWQGLVYLNNYSTDKHFQDHCLEEYAHHYSCVGVDHTYYAWPASKGFAKYFEQTPEHFKFILKATEKVTVFKYPNLPRYGKEAGKTNELFLNADIFFEKFLSPLEPFKEKIGPIMFEFSQFHPGTFQRGSDFVERLDHFLTQITRNSNFQYAVELRNSNWLHPSYFECLVRHRVAHVFNSWTRMPTIAEQLEKAKPHPLPFFISRLLLNPGTIYQDAVDAFSPYNQLRLELLETRKSIVAMLFEALGRGIPAYVLVNNRFEGCAPKTIEGIFKLMELHPQ